jgi:hypothetical protein
LSEEYLFSDESIIYSDSHIFLKSEEEKERIAHKTLIKQIDQELNNIDIDLTELKIIKSKEYYVICDELIHNLLTYLRSNFSNEYPFGWPNIERHLVNNVVIAENIKEEIVENTITLKTQKDKIRLVFELGIIEALVTKFPDLKGNGHKISKVLANLLDLNYSSIQPIVRVLLNDTINDKNYPKITKSIKDYISSLEK